MKSHAHNTSVLALVGLLTFGAPVAGASASVVADSVNEFSSVQGQNGWYYGYISNPFTSTSFSQLTTFGLGYYWLSWTYTGYGPNFWTLDGEFGKAPWVELTALGGLPERADPQDPGTQTRWAVRRWVSEVAGSVDISGNLAHLRTDDSNGVGDGITGRIFVDGTEVFTQAVARGNTTGFNYHVVRTVQVGSTIDFVIDPDGPGDGANNWYDNTRFTAVIQTPVPEASSALLMVAGLPLVAGLMALRRKNS